MAWILPIGITKGEIDRAGDTLIDESSSPEQVIKAIGILDNWRAIHSYPMHVFKIRLKSKATAVDPKALTVQRLKRVPAILNKLNRRYNGRPPTMKLSQIQDIGGCRAVLSNVQLARQLCDQYYLKGELKHKRTGMKDYIAVPKNDGYRSIHLIYKYTSDKKAKKMYNGLLVEIQIRSKLQHLWATAIETVDFFTRQAIKSNEGEKEWLEFFRLVSSAFAKMEKCPIVLNTPNDERELYLEIKKKEMELQVMKKMRGWMNAINVFEKVKQTQKRGSKRAKRLQYFLLELNIAGEELKITQYTENDEQKAIADYAASEKKNQGKKEYDVVLVGADASTDLRKAYPNYFVDSQEFLLLLEKIVQKY